VGWCGPDSSRSEYGPVGGSSEHGNERREISFLAELLWASEGLCSMDLVQSAHLKGSSGCLVSNA
jgi:hypothetical protein